MMNKKISLANVQAPQLEDATPIILSNQTMEERQDKLCALMKQKGMDCIVVYADMEHSGNFEYVCGFVPRFEEALLVMHVDKTAYLLLGNEVLGLAKNSRIEAKAIHVPCFSLPDQPFDEGYDLHEAFHLARIHSGMKTGLVGWKGFHHFKKDWFDVPHFIVETLSSLKCDICNATDLFIAPEYGARTVLNVDEIAHYEYGHMLASNGILNAITNVKEGMREIELAEFLESQGQPHNVVTICSSGERFVNANIYPTNKQLKLGERISLTVGYKGGLASRAAYVAHDKDDMPAALQGYEEDLAKPYFNAVCTWLASIHCGMKGEELYHIIDQVLPKKEYHWKLNPGHLAGDEEWLSSMMYEGSQGVIKSGMMLQIDIIPSLAPYAGCSCESGVVLADKILQNKIKKDDPMMWERMMKRRAYLKEILHIDLHEDVLPLSNVTAYYCPYILNKEAAFIYE